MTERRTIQRFEVIEVVGGGGMGTIYRAHDPQLQRDVAIKVLNASDAPQSELSSTRTVDLRVSGVKRDSLLDEARMMARLSHPNVVPIYEVGLDEDRVFVVMEYVAGSDLRAWLKQARTLPEIRAVFAQAARGLAAAHERGITHRDFKPDNVLVGGDGRARVTDFGLSRLQQPVSFVRAGNVGGTPKYMAPELWNGEAATTASDVYAFGVALDEALGDDAPETLRVLARRATSKTPSERPSIDELIGALDPQPQPARRRTALYVGAGVLAIACAGVAFVATRGEDASCADDPLLFAGKWDAAVRERVRTTLQNGERMAKLIDARAVEITKHDRATCEAGKRGEAAGAQLAHRERCLERRAIELAAIAQALVADKVPAVRAEALFNRMPLTASCDQITAGPASGDVAPLYVRFARAYELEPKDAEPVFGEVATAARTAGDNELAVRAAIDHGIRLRQIDRSKEADAIFQAAYSEALTIRSDDSAAYALVQRILTMGNTVDMKSATALVTLARDLAAKPTVTPRTRLRLQSAIGRNQLVRGTLDEAVETLRNALAENVKSEQRNDDIELLMRLDLVDTLANIGGNRAKEAIPLGLATLEFARTTVGEKANDYAYAHTNLAKAYMQSGKLDESLVHRRKAVEVQRGNYPPDHSKIIEVRGELAVTLARAGNLEEAYREFSEVIPLADKNPSFQRMYGWLLARYALVTATLGRFDEAFPRFDRAIDLLTSNVGVDHPVTFWQRYGYADSLLQAGRTDDVERLVRLMEESVARKPEPKDTRSAKLRGNFHSAIALARGKPADAEAIAKQALDELVELGADGDDKRYTQLRLAQALIAQKRYTDAKPYVDAGLAASRELDLDMRPDDIGNFEVARARIELGLGNRDEAAAIANQLRTRIEKFPGARHIRDELAKLPR